MQHDNLARFDKVKHTDMSKLIPYPQAATPKALKQQHTRKPPNKCQPQKKQAKHTQIESNFPHPCPTPCLVTHSIHPQYKKEYEILRLMFLGWLHARERRKCARYVSLEPREYHQINYV